MYVIAEGGVCTLHVLVTITQEAPPPLLVEGPDFLKHPSFPPLPFILNLSHAYMAARSQYSCLLKWAWHFTEERLNALPQL